MIATGFETGTNYRVERSTSAPTSFSDALRNAVEERGAMIPPFLLNRQNQGS